MGQGIPGRDPVRPSPRTAQKNTRQSQGRRRPAGLLDGAQRQRPPIRTPTGRADHTINALLPTTGAALIQQTRYFLQPARRSEQKDRHRQRIRGRICAGAIAQELPPAAATDPAPGLKNHNFSDGQRTGDNRSPARWNSLTRAHARGAKNHFAGPGIMAAAHNTAQRIHDGQPAHRRTDPDNRRPAPRAPG